jgi:predicted nucleic acid-binding protein
VETYDRLRPPARYFTTWAVISETYTWLLYHPGRRYANAFLVETGDLVSRRLLHVIYPTDELDGAARLELARYPDRVLSYVDALTLAVMRSNSQIDVIFAFDHHMQLSGKPVLP